MSKAFVLDAWAWLALIQNELGAADVVADLLQQAENGKVNLYVSMINAGEVFYRLLRTNALDAEHWREQLPRMPVQVVTPGVNEVWQAAHYKGSYRMSYADGFAAQLARSKKATLVTGDPDFKPLDSEIQIRWLSRSAA